MKKYLAIVLAALLLTACLMGCEAPEDTTAAATETTLQSTTEAKTETTTEEITEPAPQAVAEIRWEQFQNNDEACTAYLLVTAVDADGEAIWEYRTADCLQTELPTAEVVAVTEDTVYVNEQCIPVDAETTTGYITALDYQTGEIKWQNSDFGGCSVSYCFDEDGNLYCCGYYGPDCAAISPEGETLWLVSAVDESVWWPCDMNYQDGLIFIFYEGNDTGDESTQYRCLTTDGEVFIGGFEE